MGSFEAKFEQHGVHQVISQLDAALNDAEAKSVEAGLDYIDRLRQSSAYIQQRLQESSPVLNSPNKLTQIQGSVQTCLNEVNQFVANVNVAHLTNASNQIDTAISQAVSLVVIGKSKGGIKAEDAISFRRLVDGEISKVKEKAEAAAAKLTEIQQAANEVDLRAAETKMQVDTIESGVRGKLEELQNLYKAAETKRQSDFDAKATERANEAEKHAVSVGTQADALIEAIENKKQEAERIVSLVGNIGLTGNYRGIAEQERKAANWLRMVALFCFFSMFLIVAVTLFITAKNGFDPWVAVFRLGAALILVVPATYAARESAKHRANEEHNRRTELELASIDAYLEKLPDEKRNEIKAKLSERFFGQTVADTTNPSQAESYSVLAGLLKDAINALGKK